MKSRPESVKMLTTAAMLLKTVNKINLTNLLDNTEFNTTATIYSVIIDHG